MNGAPAVDTRFEPKAIGSVLEAAVIQVLEEFRSAHQLTPISWALVQYPEGPVVEGRPLAESVNPEAVCARWATALQMVEYSWDAVDGDRSWHLDLGPWQLELIAAPDASGDNSVTEDVSDANGASSS